VVEGLNRITRELRKEKRRRIILTKEADHPINTNDDKFLYGGPY
jgi:hypothetical protein